MSLLNPLDPGELSAGRPPVIGFDARTFFYSDSISRGIGHYALNHLTALVAARPHWDFVLLTDTTKPAPCLESLLHKPNVRLTSLDESNPVACDMVHMPDPMNLSGGFDSPFRLFRGTRGTVLFHDLIPLRFYWSQWSESTRCAYLARLDQMQKGDWTILTNSEYTRLDLLREVPMPDDRTAAIMAGLNHSGQAAGLDPQTTQAHLARHKITRSFFLHVGALDPHKNFDAVIQAFGRLPKGTAQLVVVGQKEGYLKLVADYVQQSGIKDILFTGFIPRAELETLYQEASALLFMSKFEGFGFPALEAMAQGCPVITSNATSLPEIVGDAGILLDPSDIAGIAQAMNRVAKSPSAADELRQKGRARAKLFTWDATAAKTLVIWEKLLGLQNRSAQPAATAQTGTAAPTPVSIQPGSALKPADAAKPDTAGGNPTPTPATTAPTPAPAAAGTEPPRLLWMAPWQNPSGYGSEAYGFAQGLAGRSDLALFDAARTRSKAFVDGLPPQLRTILDAGLKPTADARGRIVVQHMPANGFAAIPGAMALVGRTMFETDRIPADWVTRCNLMDEVWVPSAFNVETFASSGVERDKLIIVPGSVDEAAFDPAAHTALALPNRAAFNFLAMFEWSSRKGWDTLLRAYLTEFSKDDDVCLFLRTYVPNQPDADAKATLSRRVQEWAASQGIDTRRGPRIEFLTGQVPQQDLPKLYKAVDCLVAPSRGEGWGRPQHEAMLMELPVIATAWSGTTELLAEAHAYPLGFELRNTTGLEPELYHYRGHTWAEPSATQLRELMRRVTTHREEAATKGRLARQVIAARFGIQPVAARVLERLAILEARKTTPACPAVVARALQHESQPAPAKPLKVAWDGSWLDHGSLSHVNRELAAEVEKGSRVQITRVQESQTPITGIASLIELSRKLKRVAPLDTQITVRHSWPPNWTPPAKGAWVLIQPWEFGAVPAEWVSRLEKVDEIWVPSRATRRAYIDSGVAPSKVWVVPNGVNPTSFRPGVTPMTLPTRKTFKFLFVGGTIARKGPDVLLDTYLKTFRASDDVCLVIKDFGGRSVYAGQTLAAQIRAAQARPDAPEIVYIDSEMAPEALPSLYAACDCLVHPYRGEGFGLPVLEAMACGLPVIITGGGATDDFAGDDVAYRIPATRSPITGDVGGMPLARTGWWLEPDASALGSRLKWVSEHRDDARALGQAAALAARQDWSWERAASIAESRLLSLQTRREAAAAALAARRSRRPAPLQLPTTALLGGLSETRELIKLGDWTGAWSAACRAIELRPYNPDAYLAMAEIALGAGDTARARQCAEQARRMAPGWKEPRRWIKSIPAKAAGKPSAWNAPATAPRLTLCIIARNEEQFIGQCIDSLRALAGQVVVLDTGSTDRTREIAQSKGAEVHTFTWCDDFSAARNAALEHARGEWVLCLDADEELLPEARAILEKEMAAEAVIAFRLPIVDKGREDEGCSFIPRLFRNAPGLFYVSRVHEQVFSSVEVRRQEWGLDNRLSEAVILHHGYVEEVVRSRDKIARNMKLLELAIEEFPNEPNLLMSYGLELSRIGQLKPALEQYWEAFAALGALPPGHVTPELRETLISQLATQLMAARQFDRIIEVMDSPIARSGTGLTASMHFAAGLAWMEMKQPERAAREMKACIEKRDRRVFAPINKEIRKAGPRHCLALCLRELKQPAAARDAFEAATKDDPRSLPLHLDYARFEVSENRPLEALKLLSNAVAIDLNSEAVWLLGGQIALSDPGFVSFAADWTGEAIRHLPNHSGIARQRAEALTLSGEVEAAAELWLRVANPASNNHQAAIILCQLACSTKPNPVAPDREPALSHEFIQWYRRLVATGASPAVMTINENIQKLQQTLPTAARFLRTALAQAKLAAA